MHCIPVVPLAAENWLRSNPTQSNKIVFTYPHPFLRTCRWRKDSFLYRDWHFAAGWLQTGHQWHHALSAPTQKRWGFRGTFLISFFMLQTVNELVVIYCVFIRAVSTWGGRATEWCEASGAAALHYSAHRRASAEQRERADWPTGRSQLSASPTGKGTFVAKRYVMPTKAITIIFNNTVTCQVSLHIIIANSSTRVLFWQNPFYNPFY